ncbi:MAG TPA: hypothetical protein VGP47_06475 [Parachlamydiaceae bacterium]|nr:hypothetical protein [Parachlamydiaceae bacterium]
MLPRTMLFEAAFSNSYPEDLSDIVSLCNTVKFRCENLRPHLNVHFKGIKSDEICRLENEIREIVGKVNEIETRWEFKFKAKLDPTELTYYNRIMTIFKSDLPTVPKPANFDLFAQSAMINHTVNQITALSDEAEKLKDETLEETNYGILELIGLNGLFNNHPSLDK